MGHTTRQRRMPLVRRQLRLPALQRRKGHERNGTRLITLHALVIDMAHFRWVMSTTNINSI